MLNRFRQFYTKEKDYADLRHNLDAWYETSLGREFLAEARHRLDEVLPNLFGYHLVQIGRIGGCDLLGGSRIWHRTLMDKTLPPAEGQTCSRVFCDLDALPIVTDGVDVVALPHSLELHPRPHQILREIDRVLIPEGHVVILGINPWSLWGARRLLSKCGKPDAPWQGEFFGMTRIMDWLELLGFDLVYHDVFFYRPPLRYPGMMRRLEFMERVGKRYWPALGGGYLLVAKKRVITFTPVKPRWTRPASLNPNPIGVPKTSVRSHRK